MAKVIFIAERDAGQVIMGEVCRLKPLASMFNAVGEEAIKNLYAQGYRLIAIDETSAASRHQLPIRR